MNILITNDDGYQAIGLRTLAKRLAKEHNVVVVAPDSERSGCSHSVSFFSGITYQDHGLIDGIATYSTSGSPADCVLFAIKQILSHEKIDCVISGINTVLNVGTDILYSGTFGAAQEATFQGIAGIATSLRSHHSEDYDFCADFVAKNLTALVSLAKDMHTVNVNFPSPKREETLGVVAAPIAYRPYDEKYVVCGERDGKPLYFVDGHPIKQPESAALGDCYLCEHGYITITPVPLICNNQRAVDEIDLGAFVL